MDNTQTGKPTYIASCSGGKDSVATLLLARERGEPLDEVHYVEIMFDDDTSAELPEHRDFIYGTLKRFVERNLGIPFKVFRGPMSYERSFFRPNSKGQHKGQLAGHLIPGMCNLTSYNKTNFFKKLHAKMGDAVIYIGIAADEPKRLVRLDGKRKISLLAKYGLTEEDCFALCKDYGLLSPAYALGHTRLGCWFCPNQKESAWRLLIKHHPELFDRLVKWEKTPNLYRRCLTRTETASQLKARLLAQDGMALPHDRTLNRDGQKKEASK